MGEAMQKVRGELGREYDLLIDGDRIKTGNLLKSVNPSNPSQIVGCTIRPLRIWRVKPSRTLTSTSPSGARAIRKSV